LAAYEFFKPLTSQIWYIPFNSKHYQLVDDQTVTREVTYRMSVEEYLDCCGIFRKDQRYSEKQPLFDHYSLFERFVSESFDHKAVEQIRMLFRDNNAPFQRHLRKKGKMEIAAFEDFDFILEFLEKIDFPLREPGFLHKDEMEYLTGGWFEEHVLQLLKTITQGSHDLFKLGVVLNPTPAQQEKATHFTQNDLDVVFVHNNNLYVVECKTGGMEGGELYNKTVYLASALRKYFGLSVRSVLFTLSPMSINKKEKAETLGVKVIDRAMLCSDNPTSEIAIALQISPL
jgi:hypothetical protein